ncbi:MAG: TRAP transporter substrate-binding protein [Oscillospiraceae bacterium]|nr:TRAP transporter substrate-binding protein [Oscillospiraceae bacterium]
MKRKLLPIALAATLMLGIAVGFAGCGKSNSETPSNSGSADSSGGTVYTMKLHHDLAEGTAQDLGAKKFAELVSEKTNGQVEVKIFPNNVLGTDTEAAEMIQTNSLECALLPTAKLSGFYPPLQVLDLPYMFQTRDQLYGTLDDADFKDMLFKPMEELGMKGINFWESGFKQFTANKEVVKPEDFIGLKFRTMESPLIIAQFKALGANPIPIDFGETYNSLQQGVVDGEENPLVSIVNMRFYDVQSNVVISNHAYLAYAFLFSNDYWNTLPEDIQTAIIEAADEAVAYERQLTIDNEEGYIKTIEDSGTTVTYMTEEQTAVMADALKPVHEQFRDTIGSDLLDKTYELVKKYTK